MTVEAYGENTNGEKENRSCWYWLYCERIDNVIAKAN